MLKGRSKSFAPKSVPRPPKRKAQDDAPTPPAKRVSMTPDRPSEPTSTPEVQQPAIAAPTPEVIPATTQTNTASDATTNTVAQTRIPSPIRNARPKSQHSEVISRPAGDTANTNAPAARQPSPITSTDGGSIPESLPPERDAPVAESNAPARESPSITNPSIESPSINNPAFESEQGVSTQSTNNATPQVRRASAQPEDVDAPILPSIETNDRAQSRSPSPDRHVSPEVAAFRYPSPENIVRIGDSEPIGTPANMGPPGGQLGAAGDVAAIVRTGEIVQMAVLNPDGTTGGIVEEPASGTEKGKKKKKVVRRRKVQTAEGDDDDNRATIDMGLSKAKRQAAKRAKKKKDADKRKDREETPSDAEEEKIDTTKVTLEELCKDMRIGKKFSLHGVIKQRGIKKKQEAQRNKLREEHPELVSLLDAEDQDDEARLAAAITNRGEGPSGTNAGVATAENSQSAVQKEPARAPAAAGPRMIIVDGNIVLDENSMMLDRQREGAAARGEMEEVEENDFTQHITSGTFMKREKSNAWDHESTSLFYKGLSQYGTDFQTIAKLFPHRTRKQIKLKFNAEEKRNPAKITRYLTQPKKAMDLEAFERISGVKLESVEEIKAEHARFDAERQAELDKLAEGMAAAERRKKAEIASTSEKREAARRILNSSALDSDDDEPPSRTAGDSSKENAAPAPAATTTSKGKKKAAPKKPRKNKHSMNAGGEEFTVLGTIE